MDLANSDADFDAYWEEEARNPHRNRIRIGRQYQATIQPLLKKGESDNRRLEDLETLCWNPQNKLNGEELDDYFAVAKALSLFSRLMQSDEEASLNGDDCSDSEPDEANADSVDGATANSCSKREKRNATPSKKAKTESDQKPVPTWHDRISSLEPSLGLKVALRDLSEYVATHHPDAKDPGCDIPNAQGREKDSSGEWSEREAHLFAKALEVCGKNFSAIKKTFLPWKPVKSIIEYYYKGSDNDDGPNDEEPGDAAKRRQFLTVNSTKTLLSAKTNSSSGGGTGGSGTASSSKSNGANKDATDQQQQQQGDQPNDSLSLLSKTDGSAVLNGKEIKPLRAKPKFATDSESELNSTVPSSTLGSLKFFMDGQLVLKLNAKQQSEDKKCHWIESLDTPKIIKPVKKNKRHRNCCDHDGRNSKNKNEDTEASLESSDDESLESSESKSLPSPPASFGNTPRKAKVKVENNCYVPFPTTTAAATTADRVALALQSLTTTMANSKEAPVANSKLAGEGVKREHLHLSPGRQQQEHLDRFKRLKSIGGDQASDKWALGNQREKFLENGFSGDRGGKFADQQRRPPPTAHSASRNHISTASHYDSGPVNNVAAHSTPVDLTSSRKSPSAAHSPRDGKSVLSPPPPVTSGTLDLSKKDTSSSNNYFTFTSAYATSQKSKASSKLSSSFSNNNFTNNHLNNNSNARLGLNADIAAEIMKGKP